MISSTLKMGALGSSEILITSLTTWYYVLGVATLHVVICYKMIYDLFSHLIARSPWKALWKTQTQSFYLRKYSSIIYLILIS